MELSDSILELQEMVRKFVTARDWESFHTSKNLAYSIVIEANELLEHFQWLGSENSARHDEKLKKEIAYELADILIYCFSFANHTNIDISAAIIEKMEINEKRFPPKDRE